MFAFNFILKLYSIYFINCFITPIMKNIKSLACIKSFRPKPLTDESHQALAKSLKHFAFNNSHLVYKHEFDTKNYLDIL